MKSLPELPQGMEWFTIEGERVFPEFVDGELTGRYFCYLMSRNGEQIYSYGITLDQDIPEAVIQFQQQLQEKTHGLA